MKKTFIFVVVIIILLAVISIQGISKAANCTSTNNTVYKNKTIIQEKIITITEYINNSQVEECVEGYSQDYVNRILGDYSRCNFELKWLNKTDLKELNYDLNVSLSRCETRIEEIQEIMG